jgi:propanol-preferring alcohol dehydrogenase
MMHAMVLRSPGMALEYTRVADPRAGPGQLIVKVHACGVCRTDLHVVDGELPCIRPNVIPGHEIIGTVAETAPGVEGFRPGDRVGIPWLASTCGRCKHCRAGRENLCDAAGFTGYTVDGGYAEYVLADSRYCFHMPAGLSDVELAPWLCAGLIGYRALGMAGDAMHLGIYGFGAAAHLIAQVARHQGRQIYAFTRPGDAPAQRFARELGAAWAGGSDEPAPCPLDAAILFAPVGALVPKALRDVDKGGTVVCAGIHMSDIPQFPYAILWNERRVCSVANLTRRDGLAFIELAQQVPVRATVKPYALADANAALSDLRDGALSGAAVLTIT